MAFTRCFSISASTSSAANQRIQDGAGAEQVTVEDRAQPEGVSERQARASPSRRRAGSFSHCSSRSSRSRGDFMSCLHGALRASRRAARVEDRRDVVVLPRHELLQRLVFRDEGVEPESPGGERVPLRR